MSMFKSSTNQQPPGNCFLTRLRNVVLPLALLLFSATSHAATTVTYYHNDALGSPVAATDATGAVIWREQYRPFGETIRNEVAADNNSRSFTGHVKDKETGLLDMGARFYDPQLGRFMAIDPQGFKVSSPMSFNRYAYAKNNPYKYIDPDGRLEALAQDDAFEGLGGTGGAEVLTDTGQLVFQGLEYGSYAMGGLGLVKVTFTLGRGLLRSLGSVGKEVGKEITKSSRKRVKRLIKNLSDNSRQNSGLSQEKTDQLRRIVEKAGGKLRNDGATGVRGSSARKPHVQTEGLGKSIGSRHIWTKEGVQ